MNGKYHLLGGKSFPRLEVNVYNLEDAGEGGNVQYDPLRRIGGWHLKTWDERSGRDRCLCICAECSRQEVTVHTFSTYRGTNGRANFRSPGHVHRRCFQL